MAFIVFAQSLAVQPTARDFLLTIFQYGREKLQESYEADVARPQTGHMLWGQTGATGLT